MVVLKGEEASLPEALGELRVLPLAERDIALGRTRHGYSGRWSSLAAMLLVAFTSSRWRPPSSAPPSCCWPCG